MKIIFLCVPENVCLKIRGKYPFKTKSEKKIVHLFLLLQTLKTIKIMIAYM